jgi:hypothetical protein
MFPLAGRAIATASLHQAARGSVLESRHARQKSLSAPGGATAASMEVLSDRHRIRAARHRRERTRYVGGLREGDVTDQAPLPAPSVTRLMPTWITIARQA